MKKHKVIISGGGTGGHVFPAIAIANALKELEPDIDILFIGAKGRMEMEKVPAAGYPIEGLWISGFRRSLSPKNLSFPFKLISSLRKAGKIIRGFKPDVVVGVGGYASGPTLRRASKMRIPCLIQEQNSYPGITNRLLAAKVDKICVAYENMERFFPQHKISITGNPVRQEVIKLEGKREEALKFFGLGEDKPVLLVVGGSLGARTINQSVQANLDKFVEKGYQLIWQTGKFYFEDAEQTAKSYENKGIRVKAFIQRMDLAYAAADAVVSRAGAIAISEISCVHKPAVFIPSPNVAEDHQTKNAKALVDAGAALMVKDTEAIDQFWPAVENLLANSELQKQLSQSMKSMAHCNAASGIADMVLKMIKED